MKKTITIIAACIATSLANAQIAQLDFENFTLPADSYYQDTTGSDFMTGDVQFQYDWDAGWSYWSGGFVYSDMTDSVTSGYGNVYSSKSSNGYYYTPNYLVGQNFAKVYPLSASSGQKITGFYVNNSTYAYNSMRDGDAFAKKFGGASGNDPDWFKLVVRRYFGGTLQNDSIEFYLADYRFSDNSQDYIVKDWSLVDVTSLGMADSLQFELSSSDVGAYGMNTPAFFCLDHMVVEYTTGIQNHNNTVISVYPNPAKESLHINTHVINYSITDLTGRVILEGNNTNNINISQLINGLYVLHCNTGNQMVAYKFIKE